MGLLQLRICMSVVLCVSVLCQTQYVLFTGRMRHVDEAYSLESVESIVCLVSCFLGFHFRNELQH